MSMSMSYCYFEARKDIELEPTGPK